MHDDKKDTNYRIGAVLVLSTSKNSVLLNSYPRFENLNSQSLSKINDSDFSFNFVVVLLCGSVYEFSFFFQCLAIITLLGGKI